MPVCTKCGRVNPDGTLNCQKCGIALGNQQRLEKDAQRAKVGIATRTVTWICVLVFLALIAMPVYHFAAKQYFTLAYGAELDRASKACGGPVDPSAPAYQKAQYDECMAKSDSFQSAKKSMEDFGGTPDPTPK